MKIIDNRKKIYILSAVLLLAGLTAILIQGLSGNGYFNLGVEFSGGMSININFEREFDNNELSELITEITGETAQVQRMGATQASIKILSLEPEVRIELIDTICEKYGITEANIEISDISATVSGEMQQAAMRAIATASLLMLIYISARFRGVKTGLAAVITVLHDALFVVCCYGVLRIPLNNSFIAVILTIIGYAINNNIVVFDRIRENRGILRRDSFGAIVDKSVNQSFKRCICTTTTTLITITTLYFLGVPTIKEFSLPIILGLLCGAYSSICFSGSMLYTLTKGKG